MKLIEEMEGVADELAQRTGFKAFADPKKAAGYSQSCLLVAPPTTDFTTRSRTWTFVALSGTTSTDLTTMQLLADMVDRVAETTSIENARPGLYRLAPDGPDWPAFLMTLTGGIPS